MDLHRRERWGNQGWVPGEDGFKLILGSGKKCNFIQMGGKNSQIEELHMKSTRDENIQDAFRVTGPCC